jgi:hypothetical protein
VSSSGGRVSCRVGRVRCRSGMVICRSGRMSGMLSLRVGRSRV